MQSVTKVACRFEWDIENDAGIKRDESLTELEQKKAIAEETAIAHPNLRPCGFHHGWVYKDWCLKKCQYSIKD